MVTLIKYVDRLSQLPAVVVVDIQEVVNRISRLDLVWISSHREKRILEELGMIVEVEVIYPLMTSQAPCQTRNSQAILSVGPNAFNAYSLQKFIKDFIPLLDSQASGAREIQVTGRLWGDQSTPMPHPLKYYGVVADYADRLYRSACTGPTRWVTIRTSQSPPRLCKLSPGRQRELLLISVQELQG